MRPFKAHRDGSKWASGVAGLAQNIGLDGERQPPKRFHGMYLSEYQRELTIMTYLQEHIHAKRHLESRSRHDALVEFFEGWVEEEFPEGIYPEVCEDVNGGRRRNVRHEARVSAVFAMEHLKGGDLYCHMVQSHNQVNEWSLQTLMKPVFDAVDLLHDHKILHLDLKVENLAFRDVDQTQLVIVDFGLAYQLRWPGEALMSPTVLGRCNYYPREVLDHFLDASIPQTLTPAVDVYCLGLTLYYIVLGAPRSVNYLRHSHARARNWWEARIWQHDCSEEELASATVSPELKDLIIRMLRADPSQRLTMQQVLSHPWFSLTPDELDVSLPVIQIYQDSEEAGAAASVFKQMQAYDAVVVNPKLLAMKRSLGEIKRDMLTSLAKKLKDVHSHQPLTRTGRLIVLNKTDFDAALKFFGLHWLVECDDHNVFDLADFNSSKAVDYRVITLLLRATNIFSTDEILEHFCFPLLDSGGDGLIDRHELASHLGKMVVDINGEHGRGIAVVGSTEALTTKGVKRSSSTANLASDALDNIFKLVQPSDWHGDEHIGSAQLRKFARHRVSTEDASAKVIHQFLFSFTRNGTNPSGAPSPP